MAAQVLWHDWFPSIWLDEHQQGTSGPRIFTMPATDPINPNVHPLIYRLNGIFGQSQAAALEAEGKTGIIYNSTYTNFWQGAMAWAGWWHNQVGLLTEVASARIATPTMQQKADPSRAASTSAPASGGRSAATGPATGATDFESERRRAFERPDDPLPAAPRYHPAHRISAALARRTVDPARHRRLRIDRHHRAARNRRRRPREPAPPDLRASTATPSRRARRVKSDRTRTRPSPSSSRPTPSTIRTKPSNWWTSF